LTLETEVYHNGKSIFTHRRENLQANAAGNYPETLISGLPLAKAGVYQVICTVSDYSGTGIKAYKFTVEGVRADATVSATPSLKSGYGIWATVNTITKNTAAARVVAILPGGAQVKMERTGGSGDNLTWQFPANTGKYANQYNNKFRTVSRQVFVPVKWPDNTYYTIIYRVYSPTDALLKEISSQTFINGNMYDDDFTVKAK
ncbi:MAG: hypothetical protein PHE79_11690, partial [Eubacteriales bacterium]|nr:hypothetical protein [Eubacteriales bacterium]